MQSVNCYHPASKKKSKEKIPISCPVRKRCILATACYWDDEGRHTLHCQLEYYNRGDLIWCNQVDDSHVFVIRSGIVKVEKINRDGGEIVLGLLCDGQAFGLTGLFNRIMRPYYVEVCNEAEFCRAPLPVLERLIKSDPLVAERVVRSLSDYLETMFFQIEALNTPHASERIHSLLQQLAKSFIDLNGSFVEGWVKLPLTHQDLACLAGINRVTVTRTLHQLESDGLVRLGNRKIFVLLPELIPTA